jgi:hypothetical protein
VSGRRRRPLTISRAQAGQSSFQIGRVFVRLLLSSNIDDEGRRSAAARESQSSLRDAAGLAADPAFACPAICEYGPRDNRSGIRLRVFSSVLIQRDHVICHLPATTSDPALRDSVLPWTPDACANRFKAARLQELHYLAAEFGIPVQYNVPLRTGQLERLAQLLYDPFARRVRGGAEVQNAAAAVLNYKQAIEYAKSQCGDSKEIKCRDHFAMVVEEGRPALRFARIVVTLQAVQISRYGRLGNLEAQLEQFAMNARRSPAWIVCLHATNQLADLAADLRSSGVAKPRPPSPEQPEAGAMPGYDRLRFHQYQ